MILLLKSDISLKNKKKLKNLLMYFREVDLIDVKNINWKIRFDRNNQTYRMLIGICYLTINGLLQTKNKGEKKLMNFLDEQSMHRIYEKFILNYYIKEHPEIKASASQISWQLDDSNDFMLPKMQSDIYLEFENKILIIDAKYYSHTTQSYWGVNTVHSGNLYQIFTYVKNKQWEVQRKDIEVSGMLLYARTNESIQPDNEYMMSGNKISVKTLDLNQEFNEIKKQLDNIVNDTMYFTKV
jgi:5-methylcytosine-specific restriction enzyme subunit McrC